MSGKSKRIIYRSVDFTLWLAACVGLFFTWFSAPLEGAKLGMPEWIAFFGFLMCLVLRIPEAVHEIGHLCFGALAGMKTVSLRIGYFCISHGRIHLAHAFATAGEIDFFPKNGRNIRAKALISSLGGAILNFVLGGTLLALYFALPYHAALLFGSGLGIFLLYEGLRALLPAELPEGKTDGGVAFGIIKRKAEEEVLLRVLKAQGILYRGSFVEIPKPLLFDAPTVREDLPAYHALLFLRMQFLLFQQDFEEAEKVAERLESLQEYLSESGKAEIARYLGVFQGKFVAKKEFLFGLNELEEKLQTNSEK